MAETANVASALGALPIVAPRVSFGDERPRHRGLSHHTRSALALCLGSVRVAWPSGLDTPDGVEVVEVDVSGWELALRQPAAAAHGPGSGGRPVVLRGGVRGRSARCCVTTPAPQRACGIVPRAVRIGVAKEIKSQEYRVALTPAGALELVQRGHEVTVEQGAGVGSGFADEAYTAVGARIADVDDVWGSAELLLKVKEPIEPEYRQLREGLTLFTYLHIAADEPLTRALLDSGITAVAYETVETSDRRLPLLAPMSEVAGRLAPQMGAWALEKAHGGRGILLGGVPGVPPAKVIVLGGGVVGLNAAIIALGMQADVWVLDRSVDRMRELEIALDGRVTLAMSNRLQIEEVLADADMVIGAVLVPGALAPKLVTREMLGLMRPGAVLVDVAIDQGGCFETSHATTHDDPIFEVDGIVHYCVANMPGAVPVTSTKALTNVTLPYVEAIADKGLPRAIADDPALAKGVNIARRQAHLRSCRRGAQPRLHAALRRRDGARSSHRVGRSPFVAPPASSRLRRAWLRFEGEILTTSARDGGREREDRGDVERELDQAEDVVHRRT